MVVDPGMPVCLSAHVPHPPPSTSASTTHAPPPAFPNASVLGERGQVRRKAAACRKRNRDGRKGKRRTKQNRIQHGSKTRKCSLVPAGGRRLYVIATGQSLKSLRKGRGGCCSSAPPFPAKRLLGMCYLDVATDAEALPLGGEEGVGHLLRGGLDLFLDLLPGDTLQIKCSKKRKKQGVKKKATTKTGVAKPMQMQAEAEGSRDAMLCTCRKDKKIRHQSPRGDQTPLGWGVIALYHPSYVVSKTHIQMLLSFFTAGMCTCLVRV